MRKILPILVLTLLPALALAQTIRGLEQWVATTSPSTAITQRVIGKPIKITGVGTGNCLTLDANGILTTTTCGSGGGGGVGTSTNPFMATYFVATSTSQDSFFPGLVIDDYIELRGDIATVLGADRFTCTDSGSPLSILGSSCLSSALRTTLTDETGTGPAVFATSSTMSGLTLLGHTTLGTASSTRLSVFDQLYIGGTATTTIRGDAATSTFSNGISLSTGCFAIGDTCISGGGGTVTGSGVTNAMAYWTSGTAVGATTSPAVGSITATSSALTSLFNGPVTMNQQLTLDKGAGPLRFQGPTGNYYNILGNNLLGDVNITFPAQTTVVSGLAVAEIHTANKTLSKATPCWIYTDSGGDDYQTCVTSGQFQLRNTTDGRDDIRIDSTGRMGIGTSTPYSKLSIWGGTGDRILEAITSASSSALIVAGTGNGTTTVTGFTVNGSATSTANVGFNITAGCYAINGTCIAGGGGSGITSLNGLTGSTQTFASSSTGTDFAVTSSGSTHTFQWPSSSATARGLLTAADWTKFNEKVASTSIDTSAELDALVTDDTGSGALVFATDSVLAGLTTIVQASSTRQSIFDRLYVGGTATTTIVGNNATSTFAGNIDASGDIEADQFFGTGATSTLANGLNINGGCYARNGVCLGITTAIDGSGATDEFAYWSDANTLTSNSGFKINTGLSVIQLTSFDIQFISGNDTLNLSFPPVAGAAAPAVTFAARSGTVALIEDDGVEYTGSKIINVTSTSTPNLSLTNDDTGSEIQLDDADGSGSTCVYANNGVLFARVC